MQQSLVLPTSLASSLSSSPTPFSLAELSDAELATRMARQDCAAFEQIYDRYAGKAFGLCICIISDHKISEDVLEASFWQAWQTAGSFAAAQTSFSAWLLAIVHQYAITELRKHRGQTSEFPVPHIDRMNTWMETVLATLQDAQVKASLTQLPAIQRSIIMQAYYGGYTLPEIAGRLGEPLVMVQTHARLGLTKLRLTAL